MSPKAGHSCLIWNDNNLIRAYVEPFGERPEPHGAARIDSPLIYYTPIAQRESSAAQLVFDNVVEGYGECTLLVSSLRFSFYERPRRE